MTGHAKQSYIGLRIIPDRDVCRALQLKENATGERIPFSERADGEFLQDTPLSAHRLRRRRSGREHRHPTLRQRAHNHRARERGLQAGRAGRSQHSDLSEECQYFGLQKMDASIGIIILEK